MSTHPKKRIIVCGAGGFIGHHLVNRLKKDGHWVLGVDLVYPEFSDSCADEFIIGDLRDPQLCLQVLTKDTNEIYQLAADMGGAGYLFNGENDAVVMHNSALINLNVLETGRINNIDKIFYSSSACIYPQYNQLEPDNPNCAEDAVYPAEPDSEYGWEKLFSERLYLSYQRNHGLQVRIARFHNIFGELGCWNNGKEKAPAAICRKVAQANSGKIKIWGDGKQSRSFLYINECIEGIIRLTRSDWTGPVNIGSNEMVSINQLAHMIMEIADKQLTIENIAGPQGVRGRNSDNRLIKEKLNWTPQCSLMDGLKKTYDWVEVQVNSQ